MKKKRKHKEEKKFAINLLIFVGFSIFFLSIGYSILNQNLDINGMATIDYKEAKYEVTCTENKWPQNDDKYYQYEPVTLTYQGDKIIYNWEIIIEVPDDAILTSCYGNTTCKIENGLLYIHNTILNGELAPNESTRIGFLFHSKYDYELNVVKANFYNFEYVDPHEEDIAGCLTTNLAVNNLGWSNQLVMTINNPTDSTAYYWEVEVPIPDNFTYSTIFGTDYIVKDDSILFYGIVNQNNGQLEQHNSKNATIYITSDISGFNFEISHVSAKIINTSDIKVCGV